MATEDQEARERRRAAIAAAFAEVTVGPRVQLTPTVSVPAALFRELALQQVSADGADTLGRRRWLRLESPVALGT